MTIEYATMAYCAYVKDGRVEYFAEYANEAGQIVYSKKITMQQMQQATKEACA